MSLGLAEPLSVPERALHPHARIVEGQARTSSESNGPSAAVMVTDHCQRVPPIDDFGSYPQFWRPQSVGATNRHKKFMIRSNLCQMSPAQVTTRAGAVRGQGWVPRRPVSG
jgi:hypothetical protein